MPPRPLPYDVESPTGTAPVLGVQVGPSRSGRPGTRSRLGGVSWPIGAFVLSRVVVAITMAVAAVTQGVSFAATIDTWDSVWYLRAARHGWPSTLPLHHGYPTASTVAFFPVFPLLVRWLSAVSGLSLLTAGAAVSMLTGLLATMAVWMLVRSYAGDKVARRAAILMAVFPGSFVFSLVYSEGLMIALAALSLLAASKDRWVAAGLLAALATATRPDAMVLVGSLGLAALAAIWRERHWSALAAPVLAPIGFVAYQLYLWAHTGNPQAWFVTERGGWRSFLQPSFPLVVLRRFAADPFGNWNNTTVVLGMVVVAVCLVALALHRPPWPVLLYGVGVIALAIFTTPLSARPRFILDAFPLVVALATATRGISFAVLAVVSTTVLVLLTVVSVSSVLIVP